jgi:hypothetical protein
LRRAETCNACGDLFALFGEPFFFVSHAHPISDDDSLESRPTFIRVLDSGAIVICTVLT